MTALHLLRTASGAFVPASEEDAELAKRFKVGSISRVELKLMRNAQFHRKWWALAQLAFDAWTETIPDDDKSMALPNLEAFRKRLIMWAGFGEMLLVPDGRGGFVVQEVAKSISFGSMDEATFERLYSKTIDVVLAKILPNRGLTESALREWVDRVLQFA